jgi:glyoxylate reductase
VVHTPDVLTDATADLTLALLLAAARRLPEGQRLVRERRPGAAGRRPSCWAMELRGRTLGVVGLGRIGAAVARRGRGRSACASRTTSDRRGPEVAEPLGARLRPRPRRGWSR